jgi:hypothetical protein
MASCFPDILNQIIIGIFFIGGGIFGDYLGRGIARSRLKAGIPTRVRISFIGGGVLIIVSAIFQFIRGNKHLF